MALEWQPERRVVWGYRFAPDSFPPLDDHVRIGGDYFDLISTEYALERVDGKTRLTTVMTYRVSTHFNWYARLVAKAFIGNFEETALDFYARHAEQSAMTDAVDTR